MKSRRVIENILAPLLGLGVIIAVWFIVSQAMGKRALLPSPVETFSGFFALLKTKSFYLSVGNTLARTLIAFAIAFVLACIFAFLSSICGIFKKAFAPVTIVMRVMPTISVILLVLIWAKSKTAPILITFLVIFPMLYTTILGAADEVDKGLLEMCRAYRLSRGKIITSLYLPSMTPSVLTGVSITLSFSVKLTVAAEVLASTKMSMGRFMKQASAYIEIDVLLAWTMTAILLGFLLEGLVLLVRKLYVRHYHGN